MRRNKFIVFVLITVMIFSLTGFSHVFADDNLDELKVLGIIPNSLTTYNMKDAVTRGQFVYMVARLMQNSDIAATATRFSDVDEKNEYSGYIEFLASIGMISGFEDGTFNPNGKVDMGFACKLIINILGYGEIVVEKEDYIDSYIYLAEKLGLYSNITTDSDGNLTNDGAVGLLRDVLVKEIAGHKYSMVDGQLVITTQNNTKRTVLGDRLGISVYKGMVSNVNISGRSITFIVQKNSYKSNPVLLNEGEVLNLAANDNLNIYEYDHVPAIIWVDKNEKLVNITVQKGAMVKYGYISSVNGDTRENSAYGINYINRLTIVDVEDEYVVKSGSTLKFNGKLSTSSVNFVGKFARMVLYSDEIIHIESWDLTEGGIITDIAPSSISYIKGENDLRLKEFDRYKSKLFLISGRCADEKELKKDSLFYYYRNDDYIVLVVSEKIIIDRFLGIGNNQIELGGSYYNVANVYSLTDGKNYKLNNDYSKLFNMIVKAYVAPDGNVLYVKLDNGQTALLRGFYGVVCGTKKDIFNEKEGQIELWVLDTEITKQKFILTKKTKYNDGLSFATVAANAKNIDGKGVYKFKVNELGNVAEVSKPTPYYGYGDEVKATLTTFIDDAQTYVNVASKRLYFTGSKITVLFELDGEFRVKYVNWRELAGRNTGGNGATMAFYGEEKESVPSLITLSGNLNNIGSISLKYGIITGKKQVIDDNGSIRYKLSIITLKGIVEYKVNEELANSLSVYTYIGFYDSLKFSVNDISIISQVDLSMSSVDWTNTSFSKKVVEKADGTRIYFNDGTALFMAPTSCLIVSVSEGNKKNRFEGGLVASDIDVGDVIYYIETSEGIKLIIDVK